MKKIKLTNRDIILLCAAIAILSIAVVALITVPLMDGSSGPKHEKGDSKTTYPARTTSAATLGEISSEDYSFDDETQIVTSIVTDRYGNTSIVSKESGTRIVTNPRTTVYSPNTQKHTQGNTPVTPSYNKEEVLSWSTSQILQTLTDAITKTKAYSQDCTIHHSESFVSDITECTGGALVQRVANVLVGYVVKPTDENLQYHNGYTTTAEGETVPILLPKRGPFTLTTAGITSASATMSGNNIHITVKIVPESVGMYDIPPHNAASIGYLDVASLDLNFFTVTGADINYIGSSVVAIINADGMVSKATYTIPMHIVGSAEAAIAGGNATFDGYQTEVWEMPW